MTQPASLARAALSATPRVLALTIKQPWADAIVYGTKRTENRSWTTAYRGPVLIHAGAAYDLMGRFIINRNALTSWPDVRKAVIAVATLADIHPAHDGCCSPWGEPHPHIYHWQFTDVVALPDPVPCIGRLRLWTPSIPVLADVVTALERATA